MPALTFEIEHEDASGESRARVGRVTTPHGSFDTPAFMPVGTKASVKGLLPELVAGTGAQIILNNTYHLTLRPGTDRIARLGGVHGLMNWHGPILTDSGGFQVFSLADVRKITDDGVTFRSEVDGQYIELSPEASIKAQNEIGADIIMAFDDCPPASVEDVSPDNVTSGRHAVSADAYAERNAVAMERTLRWLGRCVEAHARPDDQALFGIVQGGVDLEMRAACAKAVTAHDLPGYAIGGVAVGEGPEQMMRVVDHTAPLLPRDKPRYLMGVGYERDIVGAVRAGIDMFDCVLPTRNGRNANAFTRTGQIRLKNARFAEDPEPIEPGCDCVACAGYSRAYLRHLFLADEMLGPILVSLHNLRHFQRLMLDIRAAIRHDDWSLLRSEWPVLG
ncbi:MAG: tRNA guanosine(34) transglycosylase Tgt [Phycisphaera sp.]|nr:tRNA guanosine(34) transglycosylase Tgt [Phycisphaera sp.]